MRMLGVVAMLVVAACENTPQPHADQPPASAPTVAPTPPPPPTPAPPPMDTKPINPPADTPTLVAGSNELGFALWQHIPAHGNAAVSPASISVAFAMTALGAKAETAAQIAKVFHFKDDPASWGQLAQSLAAPKRPVELHIANRLFGAKAANILAPFREQTEKLFGAPFEQLDFVGGAEAARGHINGWVADQTNKKIPELLPPGAIGALTRLILINAIYFLADWDNPFDHDRTSDRPFHVSANETKPVPMMHGQGWSYAKVAGAAVLELPYKGGDTSMVIVLPDAVDGLAKLEASSSPKALAAWRGALKSGEVSVSLPRFELGGTSVDLAKELAALGMPLAFDKHHADFTGIAPTPTPEERLYISSVFHSAYVKVDEKGTEAAAATAVVMATAGGAPTPPSTSFVADHPFLFFIIDKPTGVVLFMGRVIDPTAR
jgi:serpin B